MKISDSAPPGPGRSRRAKGAGQLARLQQGILAAVLLMAVAWCWALWPYSRAGAFIGVLFLLYGYTLVLGLELWLMQRLNRSDGVPRAAWSELLAAWVQECWVTGQVFGGRQPFRPNEVPDQLDDPLLCGQRGVVFIHGLVCNRGFWTPWLKRLQGSRHAFAAVNLEPVFGSISDYTPLIDDAVRAVTRASGLSPVLVCHSMGGVAARAWLASRYRQGEVPAVHRIVTLGSPHRGTWLARFGRGINTAEMRQTSEWLNRLNADLHSRPPELFVCWYSNCDNMVFPASTATLPGADNRLLRGAAHVQLAFMPQLMDETLALLAPGADGSGPRATSARA